MKKIILSLSVIAAVAAVVVGATTAFFSDTETSTGNTFTAGAIDLTVDSACSYNDQPSDECGTWVATNLGTENKFFDFADVKPGDKGENTISLHVDNNDAWLRVVIDDVTDEDNIPTEPESSVDTDPLSGELRENLLFTIWLDQGEEPGFQGTQDPGEGDNEYNEGDLPLLSEETLPEDGVILNLNEVGGMYLGGGETAYFGVAWELPLDTSNEVQTDSMTAMIEFQVQQVRNNPTPFVD